MLMAQDISQIQVCVWCVCVCVWCVCVCVCVCMHECERRQINLPKVEPVWTVITTHFSNLQYEEVPNKHDEYWYSPREDNKHFVCSMQVCEISSI